MLHDIPPLEPVSVVDSRVIEAPTSWLPDPAFLAIVDEYASLYVAHRVESAAWIAERSDVWGDAR